MKKITLGILAHVDSGKTTLSEAMLYCSGNISKLGRVDSRDSFLDTFYLERERGVTIFSKQAVLEYGNTHITLLDTPGHVDFSAETERTLQVLDYAVLVISASDGVQSHTKTLWRLLRKYGVACFIFINKTDLESSDCELTFSQIKRELSENAVSFDNEENEEFLESVALCDERLLEKYYDNSIEKKDIIKLICERKLFPCFSGSALKLDGVKAFMDGLCTYTEEKEYPKEFGAKVYKISEDKQGARLTHMKITGGTLHVKDVLESENNKDGEKVNQIRIYSSEKFSAVDEARAGTVCCVTGITFAQTGDGLGFEKDTDSAIIEPVLTYSVEATDSTDRHTLLKALRTLESEDPQLRVVPNNTLGTIDVQIMGALQLEILKSVIKTRFDIEVEFGTGKILYKETIKNQVEGVGHFEPLRHYAEVHLLLKPLKRDSGLVFKTDCKEDLLDKNWQRLILTHLYEKTHIGVLTGSPITDMEITLKSGRAHPKHTEGGDFRQATYRAVRHGLMSAESVLLEPIYEFVLDVPTENIGRAMSDIQKMYGSFNPPEQRGDRSILSGTCPVSEMGDYLKEVLRYTHGEGRLNCALKGYDVCHNAEEVIRSIGYNADSDTQNTADSVFCSHGAGFNVKWNEVKDRMHLPSILSRRTQPKAEKSTDFKPKSNSAGDIFASDRELMKIFEQTYGPVKRRESFSQPQTVYSDKVKRENYKRKSVNYDGTEFLLVDGYNVIYSWDSLRELADSSIDGARNALINILCNYQGYKKCEVILVFDAYKVKGNTREVEKLDNINVVYTKEAETADMYIEKTSYKLAKTNRVRVVTSDALEQLIILGSGALRVSSREFQYEVAQAQEEIRSIIEKNK